jgi:hypothetical protein
VRKDRQSRMQRQRKREKGRNKPHGLKKEEYTLLLKQLQKKYIDAFVYEGYKLNLPIKLALLMLLRFSLKKKTLSAVLKFKGLNLGLHTG